MEAALRQREWQAQKFPGEAARALRSCGSPEWLVSEKPRRALLSAAQSVIRHAAPAHHHNSKSIVFTYPDRRCCSAACYMTIALQDGRQVGHGLHLQKAAMPVMSDLARCLISDTILTPMPLVMMLSVMLHQILLRSILLYLYFTIQAAAGAAVRGA